MRCEDPWLSHILRSARHGRLDHESYCFLHGLPTLHPGSWDPATSTVSCAQSACDRLEAEWSAELAGTSPSPWLERRGQECDVCHQERRRRCRVLSASDLAPTLQEAKFLDAPLISPFNASNYHTAQVRAQAFARRTQRLLLWLIAEDKPTHPDLLSLPDAALEQREAAWLQEHEQKTGGIVGVMP